MGIHLVSGCFLSSFYLISFFQDCGWKGWGEISYGGYECVKRAKAAEYLVSTLLTRV
jgi:hypothetical protein